jgi:hypothetical protein
MPLMFYLNKPEIVILIKDLEEADKRRLMKGMEERSLRRRDRVFHLESVTGHGVIVRTSNILFIKETSNEEIAEQKKREEEAQEAAAKGSRIVRPSIPHGFRGH